MTDRAYCTGVMNLLTLSTFLLVFFTGGNVAEILQSAVGLQIQYK